MNRQFIAACPIALLTLMISCAPAPTAAPPDTRAADEKTIRDGEIAWVAEWGAKDVDKIMSHYADDATLLAPNMPIAKGKDSIRKALVGLLADPNVSLKFATVSAEVSKGGDLAYTQGTYTMTMTDPVTKKPVKETGKYVTVYRKVADGSWKAVQDMNNGDAPPAPAQ